MSSPNEYRLYAFTANLYLSPLQLGLQTAHAVSELFVGASALASESRRTALLDWAIDDKTIIICGAGNHRGVLDCWSKLISVNSELDLPIAIFYEDEQSMNGMATACGVVVPRRFWDAKPIFDEKSNVLCGYQYTDEQLGLTRYPITYPEGQFIHHIKQYRLA